MPVDNIEAHEGNGFGYTTAVFHYRSRRPDGGLDVLDSWFTLIFREEEGMWKVAADICTPINRYYVPAMSEAKYTVEQQFLLETIKNRCMVRKFKSQPVPKDHLLKILSSASFAATAGNQQPWRFLVVRDRNKLDALLEAALSWALEEQAKKRDLSEKERNDISAEIRPTLEGVLSAPVYVAVLVDSRSKYPDYNICDGTLAKYLLNKVNLDLTERYMNWDSLEDREKIMSELFPTGNGMLVLDEIHKYSDWRQTVKGLYDKRGDELEILVTGSARLDYYRRGGDSLQGRYHYYHMFPFTLSELGSSTFSTLSDLLKYGGFPEPFLLASEKESRRWSREYRFHMVRDDLRDLERVLDIDSIEKMVYRLPELVGSPLSLNALREDLQVSHQSVSRWLNMLENLYMIFRIYPFGAPRIRAVKKEAKHYHLDWTLFDDEGIRFENLVACHLLKWCYFVQDTEGFHMELRYFRDVDRREVDFVLLKDGHPLHFIECKRAEREGNPALRYLKRRFPDVQETQISLNKDLDLLTKDDIRLYAAHKFLTEF